MTTPDPHKAEVVARSFTAVRQDERRATPEAVRAGYTARHALAAQLGSNRLDALRQEVHERMARSASTPSTVPSNLRDGRDRGSAAVRRQLPARVQRTRKS